MQTEIILADSIMPAEGVYFYMAVFGPLAGVCLTGFVIGLVLTRGPRRKLGTGLASVCAMFLVLLAVFVINFFAH
jgi:hypothetical protein